MVVGIEVQRLYRKERFGIETSALELLKELYRLDTKHKFVVYSKLYKQGNNFEGTSELNVKILKGHLFFDFEQFNLPLAASQDNIDILHCTGNTTPIICNKPIVQTLHDIIFMDAIPHNDSLYQQFGNLYRRFVVPFSVKKSKAIITVSNHEKNRILNQFHLDEKKIHVIYNGVGSEFKKINSDQELQKIKTKYNLPDTFILFLGNSSVRKNPFGVIESYLKYHAISKSPLPLVTPGLSRNYIESALKKFKSDDKINNFYTPGYIERAELPHIYSLSSLFLFPSFSEGFGMPVLEAMASQVPVITSNTSSLPEIAGNSAVLVNPKNSDDIAHSMHHILSDSNICKDLIDKGLKNVTKFNWKKSAEDTLALYEKSKA